MLWIYLVEDFSRKYKSSGKEPEWLIQLFLFPSWTRISSDKDRETLQRQEIQSHCH